MRIVFAVVEFVEVEAVEDVFPFLGRDGALGVVQLHAIALETYALSPIAWRFATEEGHEASTGELFWRKGSVAGV